jgi:hypothetical protein
VEITFLVAATFCAIGYAASSPHSLQLYGLIALTALAIGTRNAAVRKLAVADLTRTVLTLTLTGLAADSFLAHGSNPRWQRRLAAVLAMFAGAALGRHSAQALRLCDARSSRSYELSVQRIALLASIFWNHGRSFSFLCNASIDSGHPTNLSSDEAGLQVRTRLDGDHQSLSLRLSRAMTRNS